MTLSHRLFMLVFCVYSFACAADPTFEIMKWIKLKEIAKYGELIKVDQKKKINSIYYLGKDAEGQWCRVEFTSDDSSKDFKQVDVKVGRITPSETEDVFTQSISAQLLTRKPIIWGDYNTFYKTEYSAVSQTPAIVKFRLITRDIYSMPTGFGFSWISNTEIKPNIYSLTFARDPMALSVDTRIQVDLKRTIEEEQLPDIDKVDAYDLSAKNPYKPVYTCYFP